VTGATGIEAKLGVFLVVDDPTTVFGPATHLGAP
jgi:hypothetical protein